MMADIFNLWDNIARLRRERKITQEELADFLGVTKAAVSKWENRQTMPDILLLPQLASFFEVTIDELVGYEACLSGEQIRRCYKDLCDDFARLPFSRAMEKARSLIHRYYSCYPFLTQMCTLYLNHFMLAGDEEESRQVLKEAEGLCDRVLQNCRDVGICSEAVVLKAVLALQQGKAPEAIEILEPTLRNRHIDGQRGTVLAQAYRMTGEEDKAKVFAQTQQYLDLLGLVGEAIQLMALYGTEPNRCGEIMARAQAVIEVFELDRLVPHFTAQYYYQAALIHAAAGEKEEALEMLERFERCTGSLLTGEGEPILHGDGYFDRIGEWIEQFPLGGMAPRDKAFVRQNVKEALDHPGFGNLKDSGRFQALYHRMTEGGEKYADY